MQLPFTLPNHARVWIYQSDRPFTAIETEQINLRLQKFTHEWNAHGVALAAEAYIVFDFFIVLAVNEDVTPASGCSIDSSVQLMKQIEQSLQCSLTNRLNSVVLKNNQTLLFTPSALKLAIEQHEIDANSLVFDNTVNTLKALTQDWLKPIHASWQKKYLSTFANN